MVSSATQLDLKGLKCPLPVLKTRKALTRLNAGDRLTVLTTDPMAEIDIPHFCSENGHELLEAERLDGGHRFVLAKGA
ncbi:response regulator SirA [Labrenzia sp. VG12]|nr:sulfurtransferase TusA family protein [Labrenzia sp. VG12]ASP34961.1 response regulator SirA [Labrenzia sp. VG12]